MERLTIRVPEELADVIEESAEENGVSESEATRRLIRRGTEYDRLVSKTERLERQLEATNARQEDVGEIVEYVEEEREIQRRERERRDATVWKRAVWWVFGRND